MNPGFETEELHPDYPREAMSKIRSTKERIAETNQDAPLSFTSFKMENESVHGSHPSVAARERQEVCYSASISAGANSLEDMWQEVLGKDYDNISRTTESSADPSNIEIDDFQLFITSVRSLHTEIHSDESVAEINDFINIEGNSEDECPRALETWFPVQGKDYSDTEMISFKSDPDDNAVAKSLGTRDHFNILTPITVPLPSVCPPVDEWSINDPKTKYESIDVDGRSKDQLVDQSQLSKLQITCGCNDEHEANRSTIEGPDSDHIFIMIEEEKNEEKDKENQNWPEASLAHLMCEP